jgi:hypothetical protein
MVIASGTTTVSDSTLKTISADTGNVNITNTTFASHANQAAVDAKTGGATFNISFSTFLGPFAIYNPNGTAPITVSDSILVHTVGPNPNCAGPVINGGYNISSDTSCGFGTGIGAAGQTLGDGISAPGLDPNGLQNNGGPSQTVALLAESPAINAIPAAMCPSTDQRGYGRPAPGYTACDVGAFEYAAKPPVEPPTINISSPTNNTYTLNQTVAAVYSCTDTPQDPITLCAGPVPTGSNINTSSAGAQTFTVNSTDSYDNSDSASVNYSVAYNICPLYDSTKEVKSGSTIPINLELCDVNGANVSASGTVVHATGVVAVSNNASEVLQDAGGSNPDNDFRFAEGSYIFNLKTTGYATGTYNLLFTAGNDPTTHVAQFQVR